jgi:hypothetical protein
MNILDENIIIFFVAMCTFLDRKIFFMESVTVTGYNPQFQQYK